MSEPFQNPASVAAEGETAYEWHDGSTVFQRACDSCEKGMLYAPARFCGRCGGSGFLLRFPDGKSHSSGGAE